MLTLALTQYEASLCGGCGQDKSVSYNPDADGWYEAQQLVCAGCAAMQNGPEGGDKNKPTPGAKVYVVDTRPPDVELLPWSPSETGSNDD
jgi:hypothetical protein